MDRLYMEEDLLEEDFRDASKPFLRPLKFFYYVLQVIMLIIGIGLFYYSFMMRWTARGSPNPDRLYTALLDSGIVIGTFMLVYSVFGMLTVGLRSKHLGSLYVISVVMVVFAAIGGIWWVQAQLAEISWQMSIIWDGLNSASRIMLQDAGQCCGYSDSSDRAEAPCPVGAFSGCFPPGQPSPVLEWFRASLLVAISTVFTLGFVLCILAIFILFVHEPVQRLRLAKKDISGHV